MPSSNMDTNNVLYQNSKQNRAHVKTMVHLEFRYFVFNVTTEPIVYIRVLCCPKQYTVVESIGNYRSTPKDGIQFSRVVLHEVWGTLPMANNRLDLKKFRPTILSNSSELKWCTN